MCTVLREEQEVSLKARSVSGSGKKSLVVILLAALLATESVPAAWAIPGDDCSRRLQSAEDLFNDSDFEASIALANECLTLTDLPADLRQRAYELLAKNYQALNYIEQAKSAIRKLLEFAPRYAPPKGDMILTPLVEKVRSELHAFIITKPSPGTTWVAGEDDTVAWESNHQGGLVSISLSTDGGRSFSIPLAPVTPNNGMRIVTVPDMAADSCSIRIAMVSDENVAGVSGEAFAITRLSWWPLRLPWIAVEGAGVGVGLYLLLKSPGSATENTLPGPPSRPDAQ